MPPRLFLMPFSPFLLFSSLYLADTPRVNRNPLGKNVLILKKYGIFRPFSHGNRSRVKGLFTVVKRNTPAEITVPAIFPSKPIIWPITVVESLRHRNTSLMKFVENEPTNYGDGPWTNPHLPSSVFEFDRFSLVIEGAKKFRAKLPKMGNTASIKAEATKGLER